MQDTVASSIERKTFGFEVKEIDNGDEEYFRFEGYASTFNNKDLGDDMILKGAFTESLKKNKSFKILWQHKMQEPIGVVEDAFEDDKGLYIKVKLPKSDSLVSGRIIPQIKIGSVDSMSIGYVAESVNFPKGKNVRELVKIKLFEVSLVTLPMDPKAKVGSYKSIQDLNALKDVEGVLKELGLSQTESKTLISKVKEFLRRDVVENSLRDVDEVKDGSKQELLQFLKTIS